MNIPSARRYPFLLTLAVLLAVVAVFRFVEYDWFCCDKSPIDEGYPDFSIIGWARFAVLSLCFFSLALLLAIISPVRIALTKGKEILPVHLTGYATGLLSVFFAALLLKAPHHFNALSHEDRPVEWASFILLILSAVVFAVAAFRCGKSGGKKLPWATATCAAFAFVFWFIGMEEVSWFQRQTGLQTPEMFGGNVQEEFNLHNFFTVGFEILYYFGAFAFFVLLPFLRAVFKDFADKNNYLRTFVPMPFVAVLGAMSSGYNFEMWNIFPIQSCFVGTVVVLGFFFWFCPDLRDRILILVTGTIMVVTQWIFLISKVRYERVWEVTEYKELFITIGFAVYAFSVLRNIRQERLNQA
jgi:hypothetical protein